MFRVSISKIREIHFSDKTLILESPEDMRVTFSIRRYQQLLHLWLIDKEN